MQKYIYGVLGERERVYKMSITCVSLGDDAMPMPMPMPCHAFAARWIVYPENICRLCHPRHLPLLSWLSLFLSLSLLSHLGPCSSPLFGNSICRERSPSLVKGVRCKWFRGGPDRVLTRFHLMCMRLGSFLQTGSCVCMCMCVARSHRGKVAPSPNHWTIQHATITDFLQHISFMILSLPCLIVRKSLA